MPPNDDILRYQHMLDAAQKAVEFLKNRKRNDLDTDVQLSFALVRALEIIGEAANKITEDGRSMCPTLPWQDIIGMRNRIVHAYFDIDLDRVWDTIIFDLPPLIDEVHKFLKKYEEK